MHRLISMCTEPCNVKYFSLKLKVDLVPPPPVNSKLPGVTTSLLYSGSKFRGHQKSKGNSYDVEVVLQNVDEENSYLCGYLKVSPKSISLDNAIYHYVAIFQSILLTEGTL